VTGAVKKEEDADTTTIEISARVKTLEALG
jgi:hypothetical protein